MALLKFALAMLMISSCTEQHDPTSHWKQFDAERLQANKPIAKLTEQGKLPGDGEGAGGDSIEKKYQMFCASCHGAQGKGDGPAGAALDPKPRNFVAWKDSVEDDYLAKVIREGGGAVGKSASMAPWGGVLSANDITAMVKLIRVFRGEAKPSAK